MEEAELAIVGGGPSGLFATFCAGLRLIKSVTFEAMDSYGGQITDLYPEKMVYDVQGIPKAKGKELADQMYQQATTFKPNILFNSRVTDIIPTQGKKFIIEVNDTQSYLVSAVLLCIGIGVPANMKVGAEGEDQYEGKGVYYAVRHAEDFKGKKVLIIGAGDSALDYASQISKLADNVTIVQRNENVKAAERTVADVMANPKIKFLLNTSLLKIGGDGTRINTVTIINNKTNEKSDVPMDAVIVAIGHKTSPTVFKSLTLATEARFIKTDTNFKTSVDGVYAVGDITEVSNEPRFALLALGGAQAYVAINNIKKYLVPQSALFGGHSSELKL
jgi:thioredoxin reductase (NADPH)